MAQVTDKIRLQMGEGELAQAIDTLTTFLKGVGGDLYNQAIQLRGDFKSYEREKLMGLSDKSQEKARISLAVLTLASRIDNEQLENPPSQKEFERLRPDPYQVAQQERQQQNMPHHEPTRYVAKCMFNGDPSQYWVTNYNQIVSVNPYNNQPMVIGMKLPSQDFRFAWTFFISATGMYFMVDHVGGIWGQSFGMPVQMGMAQYF